MDRRAWRATVHRVAKNQIQLKPLSISYYTLVMFWDFQVAEWLSGKESTCYCREHQRPRFYPWVRKIPWRRKWQPIPVFLPGKIPWTEEPGGPQSMGSKESDTTERLSIQAPGHVIGSFSSFQVSCFWGFALTMVHMNQWNNELQRPQSNSSLSFAVYSSAFI